MTMPKKFAMKKGSGVKSKKSAFDKPRLPKISPVHCPKNMLHEEWQRALRHQAAENEIMAVSGPDESKCAFAVRNPKSGRSYRVEYFGKSCHYNRCECMDFRWEDDALNMLLLHRDRKHRLSILDNKYADSDFSGVIKTKLHPPRQQKLKIQTFH